MIDNRHTPDDYTQIPVYDCLDFEKKTGRVPFPKVSREKFNKKFETAKCVDMKEVNFSGTIVKGEGFVLSVKACDPNKVGGPTCKSQYTIDTEVNKLLLTTYASQNFFDIHNYDTPIDTEIGLLDAIYLNSDITSNSHVEVEISEVELFDSQFRIFDDIPGSTRKFSNAEHHTTKERAIVLKENRK